MAEPLPGLVNSCFINHLHRDRVLQSVRVSLVLRDAGELPVPLDQAPEVLPGNFEKPLIRVGFRGQFNQRRTLVEERFGMFDEGLHGAVAALQSVHRQEAVLYRSACDCYHFRGS